MQATAEFDRVARAIAFLEERVDEQPSLADVAAHVGSSAHHFQRVFKRCVGVSPKRFVQCLTAAHARRLLEESRTVLDTAYSVGLSGPGRLHDLLVATDAATPGEIRKGGAGIAIDYGFHATPFGEALIATTPRGVCKLAFVDDGERSPLLGELAREWPGAALAEQPVGTRAHIEQIFAGESVPLHVQGTNLQVQVWRALLAIPAGAVTTYGDIAERLGSPRAARAVGNAVARNRVAYAIPCHRVLRSTGAIGGYRWGTPRKRAMLANETLRG
jgi:AraC family transcriptional regulator, regulatory protein of adaptative response / methylated-DNA-[protein]-cysteine methyltransferase